MLSIAHSRRRRRRLEWSVLAAGRHQMAMCTHAALLGGKPRR